MATSKNWTLKDRNSKSTKLNYENDDHWEDLAF